MKKKHKLQAEPSVLQFLDVRYFLKIQMQAKTKIISEMKLVKPTMHGIGHKRNHTK